ncbi:MAG TPA: hypothetical protein DCZ72_15330 [Armatimonadetes bacterium]|nr:hypothetical protein [Armatimonadota bacterium]
MVDLHSHTVHSDGTLTPTELLALADARGLQTIAITDHDQLDAYDDLPATPPRVELVVGVELSLTWPRGNLHLLGYHIDPANPALRATLRDLRAARVERNEEMVARLRAAGFDVSLEQLAALAGRAHIGRPHMAQALVDLGAVGSIAEAFHRYLADDSPLYVPRRDLSFAEGIELIHGAGGVAVLAHPAQTRLGERDLADAVVRWARDGLDGLEVWYPSHTPRQRRAYRDLARRLQLIATAGSDFHGATKPGIELGQPGGRPPAEQIRADLAAAAARY